MHQLKRPDINTPSMTKLRMPTINLTRCFMWIKDYYAHLFLPATPALPFNHAVIILMLVTVQLMNPLRFWSWTLLLIADDETYTPTCWRAPFSCCAVIKGLFAYLHLFTFDISSLLGFLTFSLLVLSDNFTNGKSPTSVNSKISVSSSGNQPNYYIYLK